ncbi:hypothetical protein QBC40DRAFT_259872 [Triangularia verruculosa]|uniref:C2H2-type domain-containing protein n=1 Tax=Triangularia verruculosa TaxID=2587418 RepID=A0AAN6X5Q2_9PEZI|nr:hypothetical protein QBC40DRAFT_259872 [Triangularia verruculosa]
MASLKFIMDVNDDHQVPDRHQAQNNKRAKVPVKPATTGQLPEEPNPQPHPRHASSSGLAAEEDINPPPPTAPSKRRAASSRGSQSTTTTSSTAPTAPSRSASGTLDTATTRPPVRRRSTTSTDSMDRSGYGSPASSSSIGGGPMRPMPNHPPSDTMPMRLTPITGRVSRAKKGVPVHVCELCKPAKTFTRAEHLRRHQLSHEEPQFRCPSCDKAFHRQDLLTRHQQKNEHGGEASSQPAANPASPYPVPSPRTQQPAQTPGSQGTSQPTPGSGQSPSSAPGPVAMPSTTTGFTGSVAPSYSHGLDYGGETPTYDYTMSPTTIVVTPSSGPFSNPYAQPRTTHAAQLSVITQGIQMPEQREPSPWSATDSTYSTPVSEPLGNAQHWGRSNPLLSPYPNPASRVSPGPGFGGEGFMHQNSYTTTAHSTQTSHGYSGGTIFPNTMGFGASNIGSQASGLGSMQHQQGNTMSSGFRGLTPPPHTSNQASGTLVAPTLAGIDPSLNMARHKQTLVATQLGGQNTMGNIGVFNDMGVGYGANGDVSPGGEMAGLNLELATKYAMPSSMPPSMNIPLPAAVRGAIPEYLDVYWAKVHPVLPIVHRPSFETEPEDVLRCAMAAVATQHLDTKEDRNRGNQLHEHAWQEAKRAAKWSLQIKQTILLCEYFARFRGRKPVTKPSDLFRHLYKRVSTEQSLTAPLSFSLLEDPVSWFFDTSAWSPASSPVSSVSSLDSITPTNITTTTSPMVMRHLSPYPNPSWPHTMVSSSYASPGSSFMDPSSFTHSSLPHPSPSPARSRDAFRIWSLLFASEGYNSVPPADHHSLSFSTLSQSSAQVYSQFDSDTQALCPEPGILDQALLSSNQTFATHDRWKRWVEAESCRRLLAACSICDVHTAVYQQHGRVLDGNESLPLFGNSEKLWGASSAEEWRELQNCDAVSAHAAAQPAYISDIDSLTPEQVEACGQADRMVILGLCAQRLPRRPSFGLVASADNSPVNHQQQQSQESYNQQSTEAEHRIQKLFGNNCPVANTYLALHHTPLRDLLAVSGDSWAYAQKVLPAAVFQEHVRKVRQWAAGGLPGMNILKATLYASRALLSFFNHHRIVTNHPDDNSLGKVPDISDYWALHVCALICWAFNHGLRNSNKQQQQQQNRQRSSSGGGSGGSSPSSSGLSTAETLNNNNGGVTSSDMNDEEEEEEPVRWLRRVAECNRLEEVLRLRGQGGANGVVGVVRRWMEGDCVGSRNTIYVDALGVLGKIEECAVTRRWF